jgi:LmbE family N-acetylglucosaminyl deacetylase
VTVQHWLRAYYWRRLKEGNGVTVEPVWQRPALLFSPHQDDETLGCGGTVIKKSDAGAQVGIVYMTDGGGSHGHLMPGPQLSALRMQEAVAAAHVLGVNQSQVHFLGYEDGRLETHLAEALPATVTLLQQYRPEEVYVPYAGEPPADHRATNHIVRAALALAGCTAVVYEYPVWFWHHWPWVNWRQNTARETGQVARNTLKNRFGRRLLSDFKRPVYVGDVLERKQEALRQHRSQMQRLLPDPRWLTLPDVAGGDFLSCFFQEYELFSERVERGLLL